MAKMTKTAAGKVSSKQTTKQMTMVLENTLDDCMSDCGQEYASSHNSCSLVINTSFDAALPATHNLALAAGQRAVDDLEPARGADARLENGVLQELGRGGTDACILGKGTSARNLER